MGKRLEWPISEDMVGKKVVFKGYTGADARDWKYEPNKPYYVITTDYKGVTGPISTFCGLAPSQNWGFHFELIEDEQENTMKKELNYTIPWKVKYNNEAELDAMRGVFKGLGCDLYNDLTDNLPCFSFVYPSVTGDKLTQCTGVNTCHLTVDLLTAVQHLLTPIKSKEELEKEATAGWYLCQSVDEKKLFVRDMTSLVSTSLINLGEKKSQLPWFVSSSSYIQSEKEVKLAKLKATAADFMQQIDDLEGE